MVAYLIEVRGGKQIFLPRRLESDLRAHSSSSLSFFLSSRNRQLRIHLDRILRRSHARSAYFHRSQSAAWRETSGVSVHRRGSGIGVRRLVRSFIGRISSSSELRRSSAGSFLSVSLSSSLLTTELEAKIEREG